MLILSFYIIKIIKERFYYNFKFNKLKNNHLFRVYYKKFSIEIKVKK